MLQAITTKYIGPTNHRGSRIKATCAARSLTVSYDDAMNSTDNHKLAAYKLAETMGWRADYRGGVLPDGGYCFVADTGEARDGFTY
jgi:hypothetical protein